MKLLGRLPRLAAAAIIVAASWLLVVDGRAEAHALLVRADPQINAALIESPQVMNLFFSEPLQQDFSSVEVLDSNGRRRDFGDVEFNPADQTNMTTRVPRLDPGVYTVVWRTLSQVDGHTWNGSYAFTVLNPDGSSAGGAAFAPDLSTPGPPASADAAVKWFSFVAVILLVGGLLFARFVGEPAARQLGDRGRPYASVTLRYAWNVTTLAVLLLFATTTYVAVAGGLRLGGLEFVDEFIFDTRTGLWLELRWTFLLIASLILIALRRRPAWRAGPAASNTPTNAMLVIGAGLIASLSGISHGAALDRGGIWGTLFDAVHLAAAAIWVGMLVALICTWLWTRRNARSLDDESRSAFRIEAVRRFSLGAAATMPVLIVAGFLSTLIQVPAWRGFTDSDWGAAMLVKLALLAVLFAVAAVNAVVLRPRHAAAQESVHDPPSPRSAARTERRFRRLMLTEVALMLAVLAATAALTQLSSPRSSLPLNQEQKDKTIVQTITVDDLVAQLTVAPNLVGFNRYEVELRDAGGGPPLDPVRELRLHFRYEDPAVGAVIVPTVPLGDDGTRFELEGAFFGLPGEWDVDLELRRETRDDALAGITTDVEQPFLGVLPFGRGAAGSLALPISQFDWNGVGALWAVLAAGMLLAFRATLRDRVSRVAGDAALAGGTMAMAFAVVLAFGVHVDSGRTLQNPIERSEASVTSGELLFATSCSQCHGTGGGGDGVLAGTLPTPPANFRVHVPFHADGVLFTWITDGIRGTGMPAWKDVLSEQERWDLVNFLRSSFDQPLRGDP